MFSHLQNKKFAAAQAESLRNLSLSVASRKASEKESCCCFLATASSLLQLLQKGYSIEKESWCTEKQLEVDEYYL